MFPETSFPGGQTRHNSAGRLLPVTRKKLTVRRNRQSRRVYTDILKMSGSQIYRKENLTKKSQPRFLHFLNVCRGICSAPVRSRRRSEAPPNPLPTNKSSARKQTLCIQTNLLTTNKPSAYKKAPLSRGRPKKEELSLRTLPMLTALVTFLTRTIVLRAMRAILFFALTAACKHRPGQHGGRHGQ